MNEDRLYIIDPPSPFAPIEEWHRFLASMESLKKPENPQVREVLSEARRIIAEHGKGCSNFTLG